MKVRTRSINYIILNKDSLLRKRTLAIFYGRIRDEDFIVRTLELLTFIIASRPTFSIGRVPLYKLVHEIPIRGEFGLY